MASNGDTKTLRKRGDKRLITKKVLKEHFQEYCSSSSIHGVQYVGDPTRPNIERIWWLIIFILSFSLNSYLIYKTWHKWQESPVIVSFSESTTPVWNVPFPAVTVCLQTNARSSDFHFRTSDAENKTEDAWKRAAMSVLCDPSVRVNGSEHLSQSSIDFLLDVALSLNETMEICKIRDANKGCFEFFSPVMTEDGLCFTSNVLNHSQLFRPGWSVYPYPTDFPEARHWSLDTGYDKTAPIDTYPKRALDSGDKAGVFIVLYLSKLDQDTRCRGPIPGFKLMLHNPAEIPSSSQKYVRIPTEQEILVWVQPNIMTTGEELRSYAPKRRQCFYPDERYLKYFSVYTERNCELECLTNFTLNKCGCVSIYMPRDENTPVCGGGKKDCTVASIFDIRKEELEKVYDGLEDESCNCMPACTAINYQAEVSQTPYDWREAIAATTENPDLQEEDTYTRITIFFADTQFTTSHRSELFGPVEFLANVGGLLGLFSGISFLSFLEMFYFGSLRFWTNIQRRKKERKEMGEELDMMSSNRLNYND